MTSNDLYPTRTFALILCVAISACSSPSEEDPAPDMSDVAAMVDMTTSDMRGDEPDRSPDAPDMVDMRLDDTEDMTLDASPDLTDAGDQGQEEEDAAPDMELTCSLTCEAFDFDQEDPVTTVSNYDATTRTLTIILDADAEEVTATSLDLMISMSFDDGGGMVGGVGRSAFAQGVVNGSTLTYDLSEIEVRGGESLDVSGVNLTLACGENQSNLPLVNGPLDLEQSKTLEDFTCEKTPNFPF